VNDSIITIPLEAKTRPLGSTPTRGGRTSSSTPFYAGVENHLVPLAVESLLEDERDYFSPIVFYGPTGSGKTHLATGIAAAWKKRHPRRKALVLGTEEFSRLLAGAIETKTADDFRHRYRTLGLLVLDDLDRLVGKSAAQEELIHILQAMRERKAGMILTMSHFPGGASPLTDRLVARLSEGLIVPLVWPDLKTRIFLLREMARSLDFPLSETALTHLARGLSGSVPTLFGALMQLCSLQKLETRPLPLPRIKEFLRERREQNTPSLREIARTTARHFSLKMADLKGKSRVSHIVFARGIALYLSRNLTEKSLREIGQFFGKRDHTTVAHHCQRIDRRIPHDANLRDHVTELRLKLMPSS
jgi:chromosomal replication initiator protein